MSYNIKFKVGQKVFLKKTCKTDEVEQIIIKNDGIFYKLENTLGLVNQNLISDKKYVVKIYDTQTGEEILNEETNLVNVHRSGDMDSLERDLINELLELDLK